MKQRGADAGELRSSGQAGRPTLQLTRRQLPGGTTAACVWPALAAPRPDAWLGSVYRELHLDAHFSQVPAPHQDFDAEAAAGLLAGAGFQMVSYFAVCNAGYSYYPTRIGVPHPVTYNARGQDRFVHLVSRAREFHPIDGIRVRVAASARPRRVSAIPQREAVAFDWKNAYIEFPARVTMHSAYWIEG